MSQHRPQHHDPDHTPSTKPRAGGEPSLIDVVAGDPPVPITVWRTARADTDTHDTIPARLAYRLICAYSRPGDPVVDLTDGHALTQVCTAGLRVHHPAWFTDHASLIIGPATEPATDNDHSSPAEADDAPGLADWFGDDLTDPQLPPAGDPAGHAPADGLHAATSLVVACWPPDNADTADRVRLAWLLTACQRLLRPGGCLTLIVGNPVGGHTAPEDFSFLVAAASRAGLGYLQHIVAVAADTDGDAFVYHATDEELLALAHTGTRPSTVAHWRIHTDLLIFTPVGVPHAEHDDHGRDRG